MASFKKLKSGNWRVQIRRKGQYVSNSFRRKSEADEWALATERRIDRGDDVGLPDPRLAKTFGDLIDLHMSDLVEVGKRIRRSKRGALKSLNGRIGHLRLDQITRERLIEFGKTRAKDGISPSTLGSEFSYIGTILTHAAAVHGIDVKREPVDMARKAMNRLSLVGHSTERNRRPTRKELNTIINYLDANPRQSIPVGRIVKFAVATAMRQEEICTVLRTDIDSEGRTVLIRDRKDPRKKDGNHQKAPLLNLTGYDAWALLKEQIKAHPDSDRLFPYNPRSVGAAFRRACRNLGIEGLCFHDLRHEATSRLFEAGLQIHEVALVTGHRDWKMLRRYTHLKPEQLAQRYKEDETPPSDPPSGLVVTAVSPWARKAR